ncbi:MAG TPA: DUF5946 family protein [Gemmatimonadaceae bacterium]
MTNAHEEAYAELCCYTLAHRAPEFIHQYVVDAWAAQNASESTKPISLTFALMGLYLHLERQFTGRQVQRAHMEVANRTRAYPAIELPRERGPLTATDVLAAAPGPERDAAIDAWCASVWNAYSGNRPTIIEWLTRNRILRKSTAYGRE